MVYIIYEEPREDKNIISKLAKEICVKWGDECYGKIRLVYPNAARGVILKILSRPWDNII